MHQKFTDFDIKYSTACVKTLRQITKYIKISRIRDFSVTKRAENTVSTVLAEYLRTGHRVDD